MALSGNCDGDTCTCFSQGRVLQSGWLDGVKKSVHTRSDDLVAADTCPAPVDATKVAVAPRLEGSPPTTRMRLEERTPSSQTCTAPLWTTTDTGNEAGTWIVGETRKSEAAVLEKPADCPTALLAVALKKYWELVTRSLATNV
eukprot:3300579-Rhodomonas_salina.3